MSTGILADTNGFRAKLSVPEFILQKTIGPPTIESHKSLENLFFKDDPHYNSKGSFWVAREISKKLSKICNFNEIWVF